MLNCSSDLYRFGNVGRVSPITGLILPNADAGADSSLSPPRKLTAD